jgi:thioredoxin reductase
VNVEKIDGDRFEVTLTDGSSVHARRVLLATGMVDDLPDIPGMRELWGRTVFQCPYCHGWEVLDRKWAILATRPEHFEFALFSTGWSPQLVAFTDGAREIPAELRKRLERAGVVLEPRRIRRLVGADGLLAGVELEDGIVVDAGVLIVSPPQKQVALVQRLGVALDENGFVKTDAAGQTSIPGIYAAGDLGTPTQAALLAAAAGTRAAYALNHAMNLARGDAPGVAAH